MTETGTVPAVITPSGGEPLAVDILLKQAGEAIAFERERANRAEAETGALGDRLGAAIAAAVAVEKVKAGEALAAERERAERAEAKLERVRDLAQSWIDGDGQGPATPEMTVEADCGRALRDLLEKVSGG
jgi:hypothetical protein